MSRSCSSYPCPTKWSKTASIGLLPDEEREGTCHAARARAQAGSPSSGSGARVAWFPLIVRIPSSLSMVSRRPSVFKIW